MSSDSDENLFGNAAKKLKILCSKSKINEKKLDHSEIISDSTEIDKIINGVSNSTSVNSLTNLSDKDIVKESFLEKHAKQKKKSDYPSDLSDESDIESFLSTHRSAVGRQKSRKSRRLSLKKAPNKKTVKKISDSNTSDLSLNAVRTKKRRKKSTKTTEDILSVSLLQTLLTQGPNDNQNCSVHTNTSNGLSQSNDIIHTLPSPDRGRPRGLRSRRGRSRARGTVRPPPSTSQYPTYNIGNTEEYPDESEGIPLFSSKPTLPTEIVISDEDSDENEELSIHVHWQNYKVFKFNIRRFQKLKEIFDFFAKKENVPEKRLFFAYNDVVLKCDDTPDSIKYNIAKFIEGGLVSQELIDLVREHTSTKPLGIQIKFQCQTFKKPYEITIQPTDKLSVAMLKCAEHFEKPLNHLGFEFDGERFTGTTTVQELQLESGDCIDVRIIK